MAKRYVRLNWQNAPNTATPLNAENLNIMDKGIDDIDTALENHINSMIHSDAINDTTKYPSSAVTFSHGTQISSLQNSVSEINNNLDNKIIYKHVQLGDITLNANTRNNYTISDYYTVPTGYKIIACTPICSGGSSGDFCLGNVILVGTDIGMVTFANKSTTNSFTWNLSFMLVLINLS